MNILYLLIPISIVLLGFAIWAFVWAIKSGQFDDLEGPAHRILMDDDDPRIPSRGHPEHHSGTANKVKDEAPGPSGVSPPGHKKIL